MSEVTENAKAWRKYFINDEDFAIWQRLVPNLEEITHLKVQLLKDCEAELSCRESDQESPKPFEELPVFRSLEAALSRASRDLKEQMDVLNNVGAEWTEKLITQGVDAQNIINEGLILDMRKETVEAERKRMWEIPRTTLVHDLLKVVVEQWKDSGNRTLMDLARGRSQGE